MTQGWSHRYPESRHTIKRQNHVEAQQAVKARQTSTKTSGHSAPARSNYVQPLSYPRFEPAHAQADIPLMSSSFSIAPTLDKVEPQTISEDVNTCTPPLAHSPSYDYLSDEQKQILLKVREGESIFFTGSAGTGKSVLLRAIIDDLGGPSEKVAVTGSTGIAAINIGGKTLHSWAGLGLGNKPVKSLIGRARSLPSLRKRWMDVKVLIIDEVSMISSRWFDTLEEVARGVRNINKPFGKIQLVVCGDYFQLPPVPEREGAPPLFAFDSWTWDRCIRTKAKLTQVFRQKDPMLVNMLNDMRIGQVSNESAKLIAGLARRVEYDDGIEPTEIVPRRWMADSANQRHLRRLPGDRVEFLATDVNGKDEYKEKLNADRAASVLRQMIAPSVVSLKVGAQVMSLRNNQWAGIVNGSVGRVVEFITPAEARSREISIICRPQLARRKESTKPDPETERREGKKVSKDLQARQEFEATRWPLVLFENRVQVMLGPVEFTSETTNGYTQATRLQVPLILAWALTVHKSQGQTLNRVKVDLRYTFERGQAYVALSRCTSLDGLEVRNFSPNAVFAHPRVQQWSEDLVSFSVDPSITAGRYRMP